MAFYTSVTKYGNTIEYRGYDDKGKRVKKNIKFEPTLYHKHDTSTGFKTLYGDNLKPVRYDDMKSALRDLDIYAGAGNNIIFGSPKFTTQFIQENFPTEIQYDPSVIRIGSIDIEVLSKKEFPKPEEAKYPIKAICIHTTKTDEYFILATHESQKFNASNSELSIPKEKLVYIHCNSEEELLARFIKLWQAMDLDVVTGWNSKGFDIPYIVNRLERLEKGISRALSPVQRIYDKEVITKNAGGAFKINTYEIVGIAHLDYLDVFRKFGYKWGPQESYRLDAIAYSVLGENKLDYSEYGNLSDLYENNFQKYIDYNIRDTDLLVRLEKETKLIQLAISVAYMAGANYSDTLGTVSVWTSFIYRHMMQKKIIPSADRSENLKTEFEGGYCKEVHPSSYEWICSFDLNSLYPNLIVQFNMSPETILGMVSSDNDVSVDSYLEGRFKAVDAFPNCSVAANGAYFRKDKKGLIPEIVENLYNYRKQVKAKAIELEQNNGDKSEQFRLDNTQHAIKILLNSLYGAMSNAYFPYYDIRIAEAITKSGQLSIKWAERTVNNYLNNGLNTENKDYVIAVDTDSIYVDLSDIIKLNKKAKSNDNEIDILDNFCENVLQKVIDKGYENYAIVTNSYLPRMAMKREVIADKGLWTAKKRYILNVHDSEGVRYKEPKLKVMGVEAVRSTTPEIIRNNMKETYKVLLTTDAKTAHNYMDNFKNEFNKLQPHEVSFPKTANNLQKYADKKNIYSKGTPIQVRAALLYNHYLKELNILYKYQEINSGDKIRFLYLKTPNPIKENVIGFPNVLPEEMGLHKYVDYDKQFSKGFTEPLRNVFTAMNWSVDDYLTADNFLE